jgi:ankyrin repeat protein
MNPDALVYAACREGDVEALQRLFPDGPVQWRGSSGCTLLHQVVVTSHVPVLNWLLTFSMDVNAVTPGGFTPLLLACLWRQKSMVRRLLAQGAHVQVADPCGQTALHWACAHEWVDGMALLLEHNADPNAQDHRGRIPGYNWSAFNPRYATLRDLLDAARHGCGLK